MDECYMPLSPVVECSMGCDTMSKGRVRVSRKGVARKVEPVGVVRSLIDDCLDDTSDIARSEISDERSSCDSYIPIAPLDPSGTSTGALDDARTDDSEAEAATSSSSCLTNIVTCFVSAIPAPSGVDLEEL